jgi:peptidyl-prolyl cis-trans isomerase A (cyclophilin A)
MKFPDLEIPGDGPLHAALETTEGRLVVRLEEERAPRTVKNFVGLATGKIPWRDPKTGAMREGVPFYDGLLVHRVVRNFVLQCGDPATRYPELEAQWGKGTPGYTFDDEFHPDLRHNRAGVLSMANSGPNKNGSQFFITEVPAPHLDGRHTVFGLVIAGIDVVHDISEIDTSPKGRPAEDVILERVEIYRS